MTDAEWKQQNPLILFEQWLTEAKQCAGIREPTAMALATSSKSTGISNRIVLLKSLSDEGFSFFTNYESAKGRALAENEQAAAVFYWDPLGKQVRITGRVQKSSRAVSEAYWATRARESQLSQFISRQSQPVADRRALEKLVEDEALKLKGGNIPCPANWGGYLLTPSQLEFWESRPGRLHDRFTFERQDSTKGPWTCQRLYP